MTVSRSGDWAKVRSMLASAPKRLETAMQRALHQEAHALRKEIVVGLTSQSPGGQPLKEPAPLTLAARRLRKFGGTKSLIVRGDLRNSISVVANGMDIFVGIKRSARNKAGRELVNIAKVQEFGGPPVVIPITPKMRRFLFKLYRTAGVTPSAPQRGGGGAGVVVTQVPARPFLRPAFEVFRKGATERFHDRVARELLRL